MQSLLNSQKSLSFELGSTFRFAATSLLKADYAAFWDGIQVADADDDDDDDGDIVPTNEGDDRDDPIVPTNYFPPLAIFSLASGGLIYD